MNRRMFVAPIVPVLFLVSCFALYAQEQHPTETQRIAIDELKKKIDSGEKFLLIDVREDSELQRDGSIPGAIHISMDELDSRMKDIPKDVELIFYCQTGVRGERAAAKFRKAGYRAGLFCGMNDWKRANQKAGSPAASPPAGPIKP